MTNVDWAGRAAAMLTELALVSEPGPGVTRLPYTPEHAQALKLLTGWMEEAGLSVTLDAAGTLIGRQDGPAGAKTLLMGSHQDSVREGGAYDGIMGVILPILALTRLREEGRSLPFAVEILAFADEEGVRFPTALLGSRALSGNLDPAVFAMEDAGGRPMGEVMRDFGLSPEKMTGLTRDRDQLLGYFETHIEQGPVLEQAGEALGIVTAISGIERHQVTITGETGHTGTVPMAGRRDALVSAAALIAEVDRIGQATPDLRASIGALTLAPGVVNAIPREVRLTLELRSPDDGVRAAASAALERYVSMIAQEKGTTFAMTRTYSQAAVPCDQGLSNLLERVLKDMGTQGLRLPSGATHDASAMADVAPMAMLFLRCTGGVSHNPAEAVQTADLGLGITAICGFLTGLEAE